MHKNILFILIFVIFAYSGNVKYLVYKIDSDSSNIEKYEISLESQLPIYDSIKEFARKTEFPSLYRPVLFDTLFPGNYYVNYQYPGDGGWIDFISNTNQPQKIITIYIDAMRAGGITNSRILGNKSNTTFSINKSENITINTILTNEIFDTLNSSDSNMIDTLLFEQSINEYSSKIKQMDVVKICKNRYFLEKPVYFVIVCLEYNVTSTVQKSNTFKRALPSKCNADLNYYCINGRVVGKKLSMGSKVAQGIYFENAKFSRKSTFPIK